MSIAVKPLLEGLCAGEALDSEQTYAVFSSLVRGELSTIELTALLVALKAKGEHPAEIAGAARALREAALPFARPDYAYADSCGTGGDGAHTVNISTAVAFVAAAAGVPVAKHGNRSVSSQCGSADVLEACGVKLAVAPELSRRTLDELGVCFLFAPMYHAGLRHAVEVRRTLKTRTMMNLLGPLVNPAGAPLQVMGIYDPTLVTAAAHTLRLLGCKAALVVHGAGLDELALHAPSQCALLQDGTITELTLSPKEMGVTPAPVSALAGGPPEDNARWLRGLLRGDAPQPHLDAVAVNSGALLWLAGKAGSVREGAQQAHEIMASGAGAERLAALAELTHAG